MTQQIADDRTMPKDYIHVGDVVCVSHLGHLRDVNEELRALARWTREYRHFTPASMEDITLDTPFRVMFVEQAGFSTYVHVRPMNMVWQYPMNLEFFWFRFKPAPIVSISRRLTVRAKDE